MAKKDTNKIRKMDTKNLKQVSGAGPDGIQNNADYKPPKGITRT